MFFFQKADGNKKNSTIFILAILINRRYDVDFKFLPRNLYVHVGFFGLRNIFRFCLKAYKIQIHMLQKYQSINHVKPLSIHNL